MFTNGRWHISLHCLTGTNFIDGYDANTCVGIGLDDVMWVADASFIGEVCHSIDGHIVATDR